MEHGNGADSNARQLKNYVACDHCALPVAEIRNGVLVIIARHHGGHHQTLKVLSLLVAPLDNDIKMCKD